MATLVGLLEKLRLALAGLGVALIAPFALCLASRPSDLAPCDYLLWLISISASLGVFLDFRKFYRGAAIASTLILDAASLTLIAVGRLGSLAATMIQMRFLVPPVGGGITSATSWGLASLVIPGAFIGFVAVALHSVAGRPLAAAEAPTWAEVLDALKRWPPAIAGFLEEHYLLTAFAIGFTLRLIPELLWWPWPIGWDTVEYMAHLEDFLTSLDPFKAYYWMGGMRDIPPLLDLLLALPARAAGVWLTFKFYPPIAFGALVTSSAYLARSALGLSRRYALIAAAASSLYILDLRISWDYQRQLLGSVLMLVAIAYLESRGGKGLRNAALSSALLVLMAMAHEAVAFVAFVLALVLLAKALSWRAAEEAASYAVALVAVTTLLLWYWRGFYTPNPYVGAAPPGIVAYSNYPLTAGAVISYLAAGFGLTLPLAYVALAKPGKTYLKAALAALLIAGVSPLIAPYTSVTVWYRFLIGAAPLVMPLAVAGLASLGDARFTAAYLLLVAMLGLPYILQPIYLSKYVSSLTEFPPGFEPNPMTINYLQGLYNLTSSIPELSPGTPVIAQDYVARWVHLAMRNPEPWTLVWYDAEPTVGDACELMAKLNVSSVYIITTSAANSTSWQNTCNGTTVDVSLIKDGLFKIYEVAREP